MMRSGVGRNQGSFESQWDQHFRIRQEETRGPLNSCISKELLRLCPLRGSVFSNHQALGLRDCCKNFSVHLPPFPIHFSWRDPRTWDMLVVNQTETKRWQSPCGFHLAMNRISLHLLSCFDRICFEPTLVSAFLSRWSYSWLLRVNWIMAQAASSFCKKRSMVQVFARYYSISPQRKCSSLFLTELKKRQDFMMMNLSIYTTLFDWFTLIFKKMRYNTRLNKINEFYF